MISLHSCDSMHPDCLPLTGNVTDPGVTIFVCPNRTAPDFVGRNDVWSGVFCTQLPFFTCACIREIQLVDPSPQLSLHSSSQRSVALKKINEDINAGRTHLTHFLVHIGWQLDIIGGL